MSEPTAASSRAWMYLALGAFFLIVGVRDLLADPPNTAAATWELMFATANGLFVWFLRGGPPWVRTVAYGVFFGALAAALADFFL